MCLNRWKSEYPNAAKSVLQEPPHVALNMLFEILLKLLDVNMYIPTAFIPWLCLRKYYLK